MEKYDIVVPLMRAKHDELSEIDRRLVEMARKATFTSYAPYSHFCVGAAVLLDNGEIVCGSNQENAAFPSSTCAERTAAYYAHAHYPEAKFVKIAIAARGIDGTELQQPISPCGACRQALLEYENLGGNNVPVLLAGREEIFIAPSVRSLLPLSFDDLA